jgi:hypothetical protein
LHAANPAAAEFWEVPGADHMNVWDTAGVAFDRRVIDWFKNH